MKYAINAYIYPENFQDSESTVNSAERHARHMLETLIDAVRKELTVKQGIVTHIRFVVEDKDESELA